MSIFTAGSYRVQAVSMKEYSIFYIEIRKKKIKDKQASPKEKGL